MMRSKDVVPTTRLRYKAGTEEWEIRTVVTVLTTGPTGAICRVDEMPQVGMERIREGFSDYLPGKEIIASYRELYPLDE